LKEEGMRSSLGSNHVNIRVVGLILVDLKSFEECIFFFLHVPRVDLHCVVLKPILSVLATSPTEGVSGCLDENLMGLKLLSALISNSNALMIYLAMARIL
jgi:hypothetical protein